MSLPLITGEFRCGGDPELRFTPSGMAVCEVRLVAGSKKKDGDEWVDDKTSWYTAVAFKQQAEAVAESLQSGMLVTCTGRSHNEEWTDNEDKKRVTAKILIDQIGPSVKWDSARVIKNERQQQGGGNRQQQGGGNQQRSNQRPPDNDPWRTSPDDEPPF